jgi:hypothetical protein
MLSKAQLFGAQIGADPPRDDGDQQEEGGNQPPATFVQRRHAKTIFF